MIWPQKGTVQTMYDVHTVVVYNKGGTIQRAGCQQRMVKVALCKLFYPFSYFDETYLVVEKQNILQ